MIIIALYVSVDLIRYVKKSICETQTKSNKIFWC